MRQSGQTFRALYEFMGWRDSDAQARRRVPNLRISEAALMALFFDPRQPGRFLWRLGVTNGIRPPRGHAAAVVKAALGAADIQKLRAELTLRAPKQAHGRRRRIGSHT
jgi:hypothetical protein